MLCRCDGYSERRGMTVGEQWRSLSRHHIAMETELEIYREWAVHVQDQIEAIQEFMPTLKIDMPNLPPKTPNWVGETYRDKDGKWPSDIREHCDWLSDEDY